MTKILVDEEQHNSYKFAATLYASWLFHIINHFGEDGVLEIPVVEEATGADISFHWQQAPESVIVALTDEKAKGIDEK